jgi:hypothetical protein
MLKLLTSIAIVSALSVPTVFAASPDPSPATSERSARVRAADARAAMLLVQGQHRSATVRALVTQLERLDVIVYVEMQPSLRKRLAGMLTWVTATKQHRYVRIALNPELATDMAIATLGHELQHALEVATAPEIVSEQTLANFYRSHGEGSTSQVNGWDTPAARLAGDEVRRELAGVGSSRVADSIQQFDPQDWFVMYRRTRGMLPP